ncbi:hypothetical protein HMPREF9018_1940 [Prevotella amnii CRIS 21A-A]|uniref:DUF349 domain-containing protein n=1 Tax=Prevotella amnii CRIS 21A-A TaxID=679191 RepID=E1GYG1_9BACT|nr:DUF349 domain-containing protein [Prevotella amnii]EFN90366.1 hypothetical protein HMPREF9018_1940 [Prevotella amnii CRIS 21A-A]
MDSQEKNLEKGIEEDSKTTKLYGSKKEVLERLKEIVASDDAPSKAEVDHLKAAFYKILFAEREEQQKAFLEGGGDPNKYTYLPDEDEEAFKAEMILVKEKRQQAFLAQEEQKQDNLKRKEAIIERIKAMITTPEEVNENFSEFKKLQQEWKDIKNIPADKVTEMWRNYQLYVEQFYDLLNLNREAREYDFKKNLEKKTQLCESAEKLTEEEDVVSAFHQLQELHQEYRETGPVEKDVRDEIWNRFKAASTIINKRHLQHFEELRAKEEDNLAKKTALCEQLEDIIKKENTKSSDWEEHTKQIMDLQAEWKEIGFAPKKMNVKIFERFRSGCDEFFTRKGEYFKELKKKYAENLEKKQSLVEQAKSLAKSTDWKATTDKLVALQKEWKTIGIVPKKIGDELWNTFIGACNEFFEARNSAHQGVYSQEKENLKQKRSVIEELKQLYANISEATQEQVKNLTEKYNNIGHVPYRDKDKLYKEYHDVLDNLYSALHISEANKRVDSFKNNIKKVAERGVSALDNERNKLMHRYEKLKQEINTYENNLGFLNISSKKGNSLIDEMNRRIERLKADVEEIKQKIKAIDAENK